MHSGFRYFVYSICFSAALNMVAFAEDNQTTQTRRPHEQHPIKRFLRKMRHPLTIANADKSTPGNTSNSDGSGTAAGTTEHPAVIVETAAGDVAPPSQLDTTTINAANQVPGVNLAPGHMATPLLDEEPIKGFHPIKRLMRPVENLAKQSVILGQNIMRLEAPIASLQPSMMSLKKEMGNVQDRMGSMQNSLGSMQTGVSGVRTDIHSVRDDIGSATTAIGGVRSSIGAVRGDLGGMRRQITLLEKPIRDLRGPLTEVSQPVSTINKHLSAVDRDLADLKALLSTVLASIYVAAAVIAFGTPLAAFVVYKNRHKLFPHTQDHDFPVAKPADTVVVKPENIEKTE